MNATILGKKSNSNSKTTQPTPVDASSIHTVESAVGENDGFDCLNQPPPNLVGVEGKTFEVAQHIDLERPALLDVLADKQTAPIPASKSTRPVVQPVPQGVVAPTASEWEQW
jgi:hypothetical protein